MKNLVEPKTSAENIEEPKMVDLRVNCVVELATLLDLPEKSEDSDKKSNETEEV